MTDRELKAHQRVQAATRALRELQRGRTAADWKRAEEMGTDDAVDLEMSAAVKELDLAQTERRA